MGLLNTAAKAYVATRVVGSTHRRQQQRWAGQNAAAAPVPQAPEPPAAPAPQPLAQPPVQPPAQPPAPSVDSTIEQLTRLGQLRDAGVLTDAEFEVQKQRILR